MDPEAGRGRGQKKARNAARKAAAAEEAKKLVLEAEETVSMAKVKGKAKAMETKEQLSLMRKLEERSSASGVATSSASVSAPVMAMAHGLLGMLPGDSSQMPRPLLKPAVVNASKHKDKEAKDQDTEEMVKQLLQNTQQSREFATGLFDVLLGPAVHLVCETAIVQGQRYQKAVEKPGHG